MRLRTALTGVAVAVLASLALATPAGASESVGSCVAEVAEELNHLLSEGVPEEEALHEVESLAEGCVEAPNPVLPELNELIWITAAFLILLLVGMKFAFPAVAATMAARTERIRADLDAAEQAKNDALAEQARYQASLADARGEANRIIEEARSAAEALRSERTSAAEAEAADIRAKALADAEATKAKALADLRSEVAALAIGAAEQVVQHNLDAATQTQLIENYINQVGSRS